MLTDLHLERWAKVLVQHSTQVQAGQVVRVTSHPAAEPLVKKLHQEILKAGGHPVVQIFPEFITESLYELGNDNQLNWVNPLTSFENETIDASINIHALTNLKALDRFAPEISQKASKAYAATRRSFFERAAVADNPSMRSDLKPLLWSMTLFPTEAYAADAGMTLNEFCDFVIKAGQLNQEDPVAFWQALDAWQKQLAAQLMTGSKLHFETPKGTDLSVDISGATWLSSPGRKNFPDGEVYSGPNLNATNGGANGVIFFDKRCVYQGHAVRDVRIVMKNGRATEVSAAEGEEFLIAMLDQDEGARRIGEVAFGTNRAVNVPTGQILFDEKTGGSFHIAFGAGFPETGNANQSALHWDLIAGLEKGSRVTLDGEPFCIDGKFVGMPDEVQWEM